MPSINVTLIKHLSQSIFLTDEQLNNFALDQGDLVIVKAGSSSTDALIASQPEGNLISSKVMESLHLPSLPKLNMMAAGNKELVVGPLIGIMVSRSKKRSLPPYTSQNTLLRGFLNNALRSGCLGYVFYPEGVDMENRKISGFYLETDPEGNREWKSHIFPLPDVVYDRILFRTLERKKLAKEVTSFFLNNNIRYFNPKFLNKWETYRILISNPVLHQHLPDTQKYDGPEALLEFLKTYKTVYLKPTNGSLGKDIIRIIRVAEGYHFQYRKKQKAITGFWQTNQELISELPKLINSKYYIMQQGLELIKYNGRIFDIRVLMQKDGHGNWVNSATVARIAPEGSIFPNVAAGGEPKNIETMWREITSLDWSSSPTYAETLQVSLASAEALDSHLGTFGEIGLDIGVDAMGNIWIIEINSKPSRKVFPADQPDLKKASIKLPIDYAAHLAGFTPEQRWVHH